MPGLNLPYPAFWLSKENGRTVVLTRRLEGPQRRVGASVAINVFAADEEQAARDYVEGLNRVADAAAGLPPDPPVDPTDPRPNHLSIPQAETLLGVYSGRLQSAGQAPEAGPHLKELQARGLVHWNPSQNRWEETAAGSARVREMLDGPQPKAAQASCEEEPVPPPTGVFLVWHQEVGKDSRPFLKTGFLTYEDAKRFCLDHVKRYADQHGTFAHHGTTEKGGVEYFETLQANWHPETEPRVKNRWSVKHLQFGLPI